MNTLAIQKCYEPNEAYFKKLPSKDYLIYIARLHFWLFHYELAFI